MKLTLLLVAGLIAVSSAAPWYSLGGLSSSLAEHVTEEPPITLPPGYMSWVISPQTVRSAIMKAVAAVGIPPPVDGYMATAAANRAIAAMNLEAIIVTTTPKPGKMGQMIQSAQRATVQAAAATAGRATEMAVSGTLSKVVGQTVGNWVGRTVGNQVIRTLGGQVVEPKKPDDEEQKQSWIDFVRTKAG